MVYRNLSGYFRERYHGKIRKICIDGGFTCPNRDGTCGFGGCIFCGGRGAGEHISAAGLSVSNQVNEFFSQNPKADGFIAYFQSFTNTYAPVDELRRRYDAALIDNRIIALAFGTRPDCITEEIAALLREYAEKYDVWVELGLQTANDETAKRINRGYPSSVFADAVGILSRYQIPVVAHIIIGLPGEGDAELAETVAFLNRFPIWGIKIHSIYVMQNTALAQLYQTGAYVPPTMEEYAARAAYVLCHIPSEIVIHRLTGDCPEGLLLAPEWNRDKNAVISRITRIMTDNGWTQGCLCK